MNTLYNLPVYTEESHLQSIQGSTGAEEGLEITSAQVPAKPTLQGGRRGKKGKGQKKVYGDDDSNFTRALSPASTSRARSSPARPGGNMFAYLAQQQQQGEEEEENIED